MVKFLLDNYDGCRSIAEVVATAREYTEVRSEHPVVVDLLDNYNPSGSTNQGSMGAAQPSRGSVHVIDEMDVEPLADGETATSTQARLQVDETAHDVYLSDPVEIADFMNIDDL